MNTINRFLNERDPMNRRSFLKLSGILGAGLATAAAIPVSAEALRFDRRLYKVSQTRLTMGTFVSITLLHPSKDQAEAAMGEAFEEIDRLTGTMSRFDSRTALAQLNTEGILKDIPPEVAAVITQSMRYHKVSGGAFDISIKPVVDLFKARFAEGTHTPPTNAELRKALALVDAHRIHYGNGVIRFEKPGMGITLDGIAKGYIVDRVSAQLCRQGIENHLVNAGGDIRTSGSRADGAPWAVAIEDPEKRGAYPDILRMRDGAVATSGNYEVYYDREKMVHHIVNPGSGGSPSLSASVSVRAKTAMDADALATGVFVMEPEGGLRLVESLPGCGAMIITRSGKQWRSRGWRSEAR